MSQTPSEYPPNKPPFNWGAVELEPSFKSPLPTMVTALFLILLAFLFTIGLVGNYWNDNSKDKRNQLNECVQTTKEVLQCKFLFE